MDVQMPEMSGLEATVQIRERERATGAHLPIIALTAYAMKGDRERCLEAGADGYISKPIQSAELFKLIAELTPAPEEAAWRKPGSEWRSEVFDQAKALELMGDDQDLLTELAALFAEDCPRRLAELREAVARGESKAVERVAHTLKGTASNFGAQATVTAALRLEEMGRSRNLTEGESAFATLETEVERLIVSLQALVARHSPETSGGGMQRASLPTNNGSTANV